MHVLDKHWTKQQKREVVCTLSFLLPKNDYLLKQCFKQQGLHQALCILCGLPLSFVSNYTVLLSSSSSSSPSLPPAPANQITCFVLARFIFTLKRKKSIFKFSSLILLQNMLDHLAMRINIKKLGPCQHLCQICPRQKRILFTDKGFSTPQWCIRGWDAKDMVC